MYKFTLEEHLHFLLALAFNKTLLIQLKTTTNLMAGMLGGTYIKGKWLFMQVWFNPVKSPYKLVAGRRFWGNNYGAQFS
jgi:hypothetical protein